MYDNLAHNKNAEKWTIEEAEKLFNEAFKLSTQKDYDFIGEVARDLGTYREIFTYLSNKFKNLQHTYKLILSNLEANCFSHTKKGEINTAVGIVNLKSNYNWTDRLDNTTKGEKVELNKIEVEFKDFSEDE